MGDEAWRRLAAEAVRRYGLFTAKQAKAAGVSRRSLNSRIRLNGIDELPGGIFRFVGTNPSWEQRACAASLRVKGSALSHRSAAYLWRLEGFSERPQTVEIKVLRGVVNARMRAALSDVRLHETRTPFETCRVRLLAVTSVRDTLTDLAALGGPGERLDLALDSAQRSDSRLSVSLREHLGPQRRGRTGVRALKSLLEDRGGTVTESALEARVHRVLRASGIKMPKLQYEVFDEHGYIVRVDMAWPNERIALHVDGFAFHHQRTQFERDRLINARLTALGWASLSVTHRALEGGEWLQALKRILEARSSQLILRFPHSDRHFP